MKESTDNITINNSITFKQQTSENSSTTNNKYNSQLLSQIDQIYKNVNHRNKQPVLPSLTTEISIEGFDKFYEQYNSNNTSRNPIINKSFIFKQYSANFPKSKRNIELLEKIKENTLSENLLESDNAYTYNQSTNKNRKNGPIIDYLAFDNFERLNTYNDVIVNNMVNKSNRVNIESLRNKPDVITPKFNIKTIHYNTNNSSTNTNLVRDGSNTDASKKNLCAHYIDLKTKLEFEKYSTVKNMNENILLKISQSMNLIQNSERKKLIKTKHNLFRFIKTKDN